MKNDVLTSRIISVIIALLPLIAFVNVPSLEIGLGMFLLIILFPWLFYVCLTRIQLNDVFKFSFLLLFCLISVFCSRDNISNIIGFILVMVWVLGAYKNLINERLVFGIMSSVSVLASFIVVLQLISHYVLGFNLNPYIPFLYKDATLTQYYTVIYASFDNVSLYRPSAFFLEPSHFSEYTIIVLLWHLLKNREKNRVIIAIIISIGILLTRSGMGIAMVTGAWVVYYINGLDFKKMENCINAVLVVIGCIAVLYLCFRLPFFQSAMNRVAATDGDYNAINGRLFWWNYYFSPLSFSQLLLGCGYGAVELDKYMTGFMKLLYCSGIIGVIFFYLMLFQHVERKDKFKNIAIVFYSVLIVFAGLVSVIHLVFYLTIILSKKIDVERQITMSNTLNAHLERL